jgi:hypothetical protein
VSLHEKKNNLFAAIGTVEDSPLSDRAKARNCNRDGQVPRHVPGCHARKKKWTQKRWPSTQPERLPHRRRRLRSYMYLLHWEWPPVVVVPILMWVSL